MAALMTAASAIDSLALWNFFPMHMRGIEPTATDAMHFILAINPFVVLGVAAGAAASGKWFRLYSIGTILIMVITAAFAFRYAREVGANLATPWLGLAERISQYADQLWQAVFAGTLLCPHTPPRIGESGKAARPNS